MTFILSFSAVSFDGTVMESYAFKLTTVDKNCSATILASSENTCSIISNAHCINFDKDKKNIQLHSDLEPMPLDTEVLKIDVTKYEMYRDLVGTLLTPNEMIIDNKMGMIALNDLPIPFKLSFNTLLMKGIIKEL